MSFPSRRAVEAMRDAYDAASVGPSTTWELLGEALDAAHDPALGLDRSVCLRDVVKRLWDEAASIGTGKGYGVAADLIKREFGALPPDSASDSDPSSSTTGDKP